MTWLLLFIHKNRVIRLKTKSNIELNCEVAKELGFQSQVNLSGDSGVIEKKHPDAIFVFENENWAQRCYTECPEDMFHILHANQIHLIFGDLSRGEESIATSNLVGTMVREWKSEFEVCDLNPLRAGIIVFLQLSDTGYALDLATTKKLSALCQEQGIQIPSNITRKERRIWAKQKKEKK
jgi:Protein of unknown function (DUF2591).